MLRPIIVSILTMAWCIGRYAPEELPDPDAPPDVMPATCAVTSPDPIGHSPTLYALAGQTKLTRADRTAIAQDDLAALRYLIRAVRQRGRQRSLPLALRSRPLLHALNTLAPLRNRKRLSKARLTALYTQFGPDAALAVALARRHTRPDPVLAALLKRDADSVPGLAHMQHCAELKRAPTLKGQCGQPLARYPVPFVGEVGSSMRWPVWGDKRLPGCEFDAALAERLMTRMPAWRKNPTESADPDWRACYAGLAQHLAQRGDARVDSDFIEWAHPDQPRNWRSPAEVRQQAERSWSRWTFEHALLALSPRTATPPSAVCGCQSIDPYRVDAPTPR